MCTLYYIQEHCNVQNVNVPGCGCTTIILYTYSIAFPIGFHTCVYYYFARHYEVRTMDYLLCPALPPSASMTLPSLSYDTQLPQDNDMATHTYETPMNRLRPSVTISLDHADSSESMIINHTRSGSHAEASVYEEPLVSVPQYDSILGAQVREGITT